MKRSVVLVVGLLLGAAAGVGLLYVNPLTVERSASVNANTNLYYEYPSDSSLVVTHSGNVKIQRQPPGIAELWESNIANSMLNVLILSNEQSEPVALASRMSKLSARSNLLTKGIVQSDYWLITYPGQGTFYLESDSNIWPLARETLVNVDLLGRPWEGPMTFRPTIGPDLDGTAAIVGASGALREHFGSGTESYEIAEYSPDSAYAGPIRGHLSLRLLAPEYESGESAESGL